MQFSCSETTKSWTPDGSSYQGEFDRYGDAQTTYSSTWSYSGSLLSSHSQTYGASVAPTPGTVSLSGAVGQYYDAQGAQSLDSLDDLADAGNFGGDNPVPLGDLDFGPDTGGDFAGAGSGGDFGSGSVDTGTPFADGGGSFIPEAVRSFASDYWHYLTNPSELDSDLKFANTVAYGLIGIAAGGLITTAATAAGAGIIAANAIGGAVGGGITGVPTDNVIEGTVGGAIGGAFLGAAFNGIGKLVRAAGSSIAEFARAAEFGILPHAVLKKLTEGTGLHAHHLIEERFARILGVNPKTIPSIALTPAEHQPFTNQWRQLIGYSRDKTPITTINATPQDVLNAARKIYKDFPDILQALGL